MDRNEIALMYSGGLDTTYMALQLAKEFQKVHLLTFCNGVCVNPDASKRHVQILRNKFGMDKFEHSIIPVEEILSFLKKGLSKDVANYKTPLLFDLCCRMSMEVATILYCLPRGIRYVTDGNNPNTQGEMFIQQTRYLNAAAEFFSRYGIETIRSYTILDSRDKIIRRLNKAGINTGIKWLRFLGITTQLFTQPFCLWAPVAFLFTSGLRKMPFIKYFNLSVEDAIRYRKEKEKLAIPFIDYFKSDYTMSSERPCTGKLSRFFKCISPKCS